MKAKFANEMGWTDVKPWEVIKVVSPKCIEVRSMKASLAPDWKPDIIPGGFAGHCVNNHDQEWVIESDESGQVKRLRLHKSGAWKCAGGSKFSLADNPIKFHDYNF